MHLLSLKNLQKILPRILSQIKFKGRKEGGVDFNSIQEVRILKSGLALFFFVCFYKGLLDPLAEWKTSLVMIMI